MEYYIRLAEEQTDRYHAYVEAHPDNDRLTNRLEFFRQSYEVHITASILAGFLANKDQVQPR